QSHTILLIQPNTKPESRTYSDYETKDECMEGNTDYKSNSGLHSHGKSLGENCFRFKKNQEICFKLHKRILNSSFQRISCDFNEFLQCPKQPFYEPHNKEWIKENIYVMLRRQAGK
ncbi:unnamed protein product, partial [Porites lobata]